MTKKSGPIYHLRIMLSKLLELLDFEELPLLLPYRTITSKRLSTGTAEPALAPLLPIKGLPAMGVDL